MARASTKWLLALLLLVAAATVASVVWQRRATVALQREPTGGPATGNWHRAIEGSDEARRPDQLARLLSLPYVSGSKVATGSSGIIIHSPDHAYPGVNLVISGHAPEAILMSMEGKVLHRWRLDAEAAFGEVSNRPEMTWFRRAQLLPGGEILTLLQGKGLVKLDARSEPLWALDLGVYNDLELLPDGTIHTLGKEARLLPESGRQEMVLEDSLVTVSPSGRPLGRISLFRAFIDSPYESLLTPLGPESDILHSNTIHSLDGSLAHLSDLYREGNLLLSFREIDTIAILDPEREKIVWAARGPWVGQHEPVLLENGHILLFDNLGADGRARLVETDPLSGEIVWEYRGPEGRPLYSPEAGSCQRLPNGNTLITESVSGRAFEITRQGEIVWEFVSPHRAGENREFIATLFDVVRLEPELADFVSQGL